MRSPIAPNARGSSKAERRSPSRRRALVAVLLLIVAVGAGGFFAWQKLAGTGTLDKAVSSAPFATQQVQGLTVNFLHPKGQLQRAVNDVVIEFRDTASGELVDVGTVKFDLDMNMPGMVMHDGSTIQRTGTLGRYRAKVEPEMGGDWMAALHFEGPRGKGQVSFSVNVKL